MGVAVLFLYYLHRQTEKKDAEISTARAETKDMVSQVIDSQEKRLLADADHRLLIEKLIDKSGSSEQIMRESFARAEANQASMLNELQRLRELIK